MRKVPLSPVPSSEHCCPPEEGDKSSVGEEENRIQSAAADKDSIDNVLPKVKELVSKDRDVLEKGTKAFISYIRAYKEHHCAFIFR